MKLVLVIDEALVRNMNGEGTTKELVLGVTTKENDDMGDYVGSRSLHVPVPYATEVGEQPQLIGRCITIDIEGI